MSKVKIVVDDDPSIAVTSDNFVVSFKRTDSYIQFKTTTTAKLGSYYFAIAPQQLPELIEFLQTVQKTFAPKKEGK